MTWIIGIVAPILGVLVAAVFKLWKDNKELNKEKDNLHNEFRKELTEVYIKTTEVTSDIANTMRQQIEVIQQIDQNTDELESALKSISNKVEYLADEVHKLEPKDGKTS